MIHCGNELQFNLLLKSKSLISVQKCNYIQQQNIQEEKEKEEQEEEDDDDDGGFRLKTSACRVQPSGNLNFNQRC